MARKLSNRAAICSRGNKKRSVLREEPPPFPGSGRQRGEASLVRQMRREHARLQEEVAILKKPQRTKSPHFVCPFSG
jgi:hypothetical protein